MGAAALVSGSSAMVALAAPSDAAPEAVVANVEQGAGIETQRSVEGTFSYTQTALTSSDRIANVFCKAAQTMCTSMPSYSAQAVNTQLITVTGTDRFEASVADMAQSDDAQSYTMACSCATNQAGGGAIANAEVAGVSLASVMAQAGVSI